MQTIGVNTSEYYEVHIGSGLLSRLGDYLEKSNEDCRAVVISDTNVWPLYGEIVQKSLISSGFGVLHFVFDAGEASKTMAVYLQILTFMAENRITRSDFIVALGGGVVGDMSGFVAATYLRGIAYIQLPTSLLAMVDSSVGGKTAIDLPAGKNLVGAFLQPKLVLCDTDVLTTLPYASFIDGCAEIIKYGILYDGSMIGELSNTGVDFDYEAIVAKCIGFKRDVVAVDEFDTGIRRKLNLGHTIGHGIEKLSQYGISHGQAVATGMAVITKAAYMNGYCEESVYTEICNVLRRFSLPTHTSYAARELFLSALSDKKRSSGKLNLIIPRQIGHCDVIPVPIDELESFIEAGL